MSKRSQLGIMQGRLLPKYRGRYQAHPVGYWKDEFSIAAGLGLDLIEFILDSNDVYENPVMNEPGIHEILTLTEKTGVAVKSICADYFMEAPLHSSSDMALKESQKVLETLIINSSKLGVCDIVIPCVDQATLANNNKNIERFISNVRPAVSLVEKLEINLALETDLAPGPFSELLGKLDSPQITVNYDTGNSASLGYDPEEELKAYGGRISDIHIKDRLLNGGSVILGSGDTDFERFFAVLIKVGYEGPFIMQAYRDDEGIKIFKEQLQWIMPFLKSHGFS
ncbi:MAG: TIM barrel protein [Thermodesulfobacteriota bacterium]